MNDPELCQKRGEVEVLSHGRCTCGLTRPNTSKREAIGGLETGVDRDKERPGQHHHQQRCTTPPMPSGLTPEARRGTWSQRALLPPNSNEFTGAHLHCPTNLYTVANSPRAPRPQHPTRGAVLYVKTHKRQTPAPVAQVEDPGSMPLGRRSACRVSSGPSIDGRSC